LTLATQQTLETHISSKYKKAHSFLALHYELTMDFQTLFLTFNWLAIFGENLDNAVSIGVIAESETAKIEAVLHRTDEDTLLDLNNRLEVRLNL
jgi:hypothetical protein